LLKQTVLPNDRRITAYIISTIALLAQKLKGFRIEIGDNAYLEGANDNGLSPWINNLEAAIL